MTIELIADLDTETLAEVIADNINTQRAMPDCPTKEVAILVNRRAFEELESRRLAGEKVPSHADVLNLAAARLERAK